MKKKYGVILGMLVGVFVFMLTGCTPKVDISKFVTIECKGASGYANVSAELNSKDLLLEIFGEDLVERLEKDHSDIDKYSDLIEAMGAVSKIEIKLDKKEKAANGDKIKVTVEMSDEVEEKMHARFTNMEYEYTVGNLKEAKAIDPFAGDIMEVHYQGVSPDSSVSITNIASEGAIQDIKYTLSESENLNNGDTVTVKANCDEEELMEAGYVLSQKEKSITVSNPYKYVTAASEITSDLNEKMSVQALDVVKAYSAECNVDKPDWKYVGRYILTNKSAEPGYDETHCRVYYIYRASVVPKNHDYKKQTVMIPVRYENVVVCDDGTSTYIPSENAQRMKDGDDPFEIDSWSSHFDCYLDEQKMFDDLVTRVTDRYTYEVTDSLKDLK